MVNKNEALLNWAMQNPYLNEPLLFNFLSEHDGACAIVPVAGEPYSVSFIDGTKRKQYDFFLQVRYTLSDTTDDVNVEKMFTMDQWQDWIEEMEEQGNYPDFGKNCFDCELINLSNMPQQAMMFDGNMAMYQFPVRFLYREEK